MSDRIKPAAKTLEPKRDHSPSQANKSNFSPSIDSPIDQILFLQRTVGNQVVEGLLKSNVIQAKLTIGQRGDIYEQEADRIAEQVTRMPDLRKAQRKEGSRDNKSPSMQRMCTGCEEESQRRTQNSELGSSSQEELHLQPMEEEEELLRTKEVSGSTPEVTPSIESQIKSIRGGGQPLPESVRTFFEPRFGQDFSGVRVHTDSQANESAKSLSALAYTVGRDIVFSGGQYSPETESGKRLIAHELTHVVQQTSNHVADIIATHNPTSPQRQASSELIQCTPAPPIYRGVTGVLDPGKIRIDDIADFRPTWLDQPRSVSVHVTDPAVKHITWELYDPNDEMIDGYSTLPGQASSITRPFILKPSHFSSGDDFVVGKYLLRCSGLNARHEPIVYADRDFNILRPEAITISPQDYSNINIEEMSRGRGTFDGGFGSRAFRRFIYEDREISKSEASKRMVGQIIRQEYPRSFYDPNKRWAVTVSIIAFDTGVQIRDEVWHILSDDPRDAEMALAVLRGSEAGVESRFGGGAIRGRSGEAAAQRRVPVAAQRLPGRREIEAMFGALGGPRGYQIRICNDGTVVRIKTKTVDTTTNIGIETRYAGGALADVPNRTIWIHESALARDGVVREWGAKLNLRQVIAHEIGHAKNGGGTCAAASRTGANTPGLTAAEKQGLLDDAMHIERGGPK